MFNLPKYFTFTSGQATLLAILIATAVAVVTAVGVTTRQTSSFRRTTYTTQTDQSFSCANSAVDAALLCITEKEKSGQNGTTCSATDTPLGGNICKYSYTVQNLTGDLKLDTLLKGNVQQLNTTGVGSITIKWKSGAAPQPGMEFTYAYLEGGVAKMKKFAYTCNNNFPTGVSVVGFSNVNSSGSNPCQVILNSSSGQLVSTSTNSIIRIKPLFNDAYVEVTDSDVTLNQGLKILAKGNAGNIVRNIEVARMNPQLPALFDYVLYSEEGSISK